LSPTYQIHTVSNDSQMATMPSYDIFSNCQTITIGESNGSNLQ
jgi:hypothetical protein